MARFDNSYARLSDSFYARLNPGPVASPTLIRWNDALASDLGITDQNPDIWAGNTLLTGAEPIAQAYAGHQFGNFVPQLGDGRAILLGEIIDTKGQRHDLQLKGSGRTPFSRNGDGRAALGPVLREYIVSEAMHALGVPTTRALAAVRTGERVQREITMPGAILTRIAHSHIRVGTFEYFAARGDTAALQTLYEYARNRHYPYATSPTEFLQAVINRQSTLIPQWMGLGFIHGVMNTDNTLVSGETIDYGPCAFMDRYHPTTVFSSIDHMGRYAWAAQADIIVWNMAKLASALVPLMPDVDQAIKDMTEQINAMPALIRANWHQTLGQKFGVTETDKSLFDDFLNLMAAQKLDFTNTFRALTSGSARALFADPIAYDAWHERWQDLSPDVKQMARANPVIIPRNHRIEQAIQAALTDDDTPFHILVDALKTPFDPAHETSPLAAAPEPHEIVHRTFCGT